MTEMYPLRTAVTKILEANKYKESRKIFLTLEEIKYIIHFRSKILWISRFCIPGHVGIVGSKKATVNENNPTLSRAVPHTNKHRKANQRSYKMMLAEQMTLIRLGK